MPRRHRSENRAPFLASAALLAFACALLACTPDGDSTREPTSKSELPAVSARAPSERPSEPHADEEDEETVEFEDLDDLANAIERGRFAERVGADFEAEEVASMPTTLVVAFVRGTDVPSEEAPAVEEFARSLSDRRDVVIRLIGCSDPSGSAAVNQRISLARARSVAARLSQLGVRPDQIVNVEGRGEECAVPQRAVLVIPERVEFGVIEAEAPPESEPAGSRSDRG